MQKVEISIWFIHTTHTKKHEHRYNNITQTCLFLCYFCPLPLYHHYNTGLFVMHKYPKDAQIFSYFVAVWALVFALEW